MHPGRHGGVQHTHTHAHTYTRTHPLYHPPDGSVSRLANIEIGRRAVRGLEKACPFQALNQKIGSFCCVVFSPLFLCKDLFRGFDLTYYKFTLIPCTFNNRLWSNGLCLYAFTTLQKLLCTPARVACSSNRYFMSKTSNFTSALGLNATHPSESSRVTEHFCYWKDGRSTTFILWSFRVLVGQSGRWFLVSQHLEFPGGSLIFVIQAVSIEVQFP